jgi:hypothetical protein
MDGQKGKLLRLKSNLETCEETHNTQCGTTIT